MRTHAEAAAAEYNRTVDHEWLGADIGAANDR